MSSALTFERPFTMVDLAIFAATAQELKVLLVQRPTGAGEPFPDHWALPGGFVNIHQDQDLQQCALRKLKEKTGVAAPYLEQVGSWGSATRDPRGWSATHLYLALLPELEEPLVSGGNTADAQWSTVDGNRIKERLAFDHSELLQAALSRLRNKVEYTSLPAFLMPAEFTLTELQRVYEVVLGRSLEKKAFRTRILATDLLEELPRMREGRSRPAQLFRVRQKREPVYFARTFSPRG